MIPPVAGSILRVCPVVASFAGPTTGRCLPRRAGRAAHERCRNRELSRPGGSMTDGYEADPAQGTPGRRALGAMESAVRRARASSGEPSPDVASRPGSNRRDPARGSAIATTRSPAQRTAGSLACPVRRRRRGPRGGGSGRARGVPQRRRNSGTLDAVAHRFGAGRRAVRSTADSAGHGHAGGPAPSSTSTSTSALTPDIHRRAPGGRRPTGHLRPEPVERRGGPGHRGGRRELPQRRRADRGDLQRSGRSDELSRPEHLQRDGATDVGRTVGAGGDHHAEWNVECGDVHLRVADRWLAATRWPARGTPAPAPSSRAAARRARPSPSWAGT